MAVTTEEHRLAAALAVLEKRSRSEPELERYRSPAASCEVPEGWFVSDALRFLIETDSWWPSSDHRQLPIYTIPFPEMTSEILLAPYDDNRLVSWIFAGTLGWEVAQVASPMLRIPQPSAPLLVVFTSGGFETLCVFPDEAAMFESFVIAYDEMGLMEDPPRVVDTRFAEWILEPPRRVWGDPSESEMNTHRRLKQLAETWTTDHPLWDPTLMPFQHDLTIPSAIADVLNGARIAPNA